MSRSLYFYAPCESVVMFGGVPSTIERANVFEYLNVGHAQSREAGTSKKNSRLSNGQRLHTTQWGWGVAKVTS
jgi:hypothetical protein